MKKYYLMNHTADMGLKIKGATMEELFENAAFAMFDQITDIDALSEFKTIKLSVSGEDLVDLMFNWLRELLYLWNGKRFLVKNTKIADISKNKLSAEITLDSFNGELHEINTEIKAVTYHQLFINHSPSGSWSAQIIFDI